MMKKIIGYILLTVFSLTIMSTAAMAQMRDRRSPAEKAFEFRTALMHTMEWKFGKLVQAKMKGDKAAFQKNAADLAFLTTMIPEGFELKNSIVKHSDAKKEIWEDWSTFLEKAKDIHKAASGLAAADYDMSSFDPRKFGGQNCGACHRKFKKRDRH